MRASSAAVAASCASAASALGAAMASAGASQAQLNAAGFAYVERTTATSLYGVVPPVPPGAAFVRISFEQAYHRLRMRRVFGRLYLVTDPVRAPVVLLHDATPSERWFDLSDVPSLLRPAAWLLLRLRRMR